MPQMDGYKLAQLIKREAEMLNTKIILIVPSMDKEARQKISESKLDYTLPKPVQPGDLLEVVNRVFQSASVQVRQTYVDVPPPAVVAPVVPPVPAPVAVPVAPRVPVEDLSQEKKQGALTILLAEDNLINQAVAAGVLRSHGHQIIVANNGVQALDVFKNHSVDLILMDVQMPEMDGLTATRAIRRIESGTGRHIPIIAVTAHAMKGDREKCIASGMDDFLTKPYTKEKLSNMVDDYRAEPAVTERPAPSPVVEGSVQTVAVNAIVEKQTSPVGKPTGEAVSPQHTEPKVVVSKFEEIVEMLGSPDLVKTLVNIFLTQTPKMMEELAKAVETRDAHGINRAAHSLKGSLGNFGAKSAMKMAHSLEFAGKSEELVEVEEMFNAFQSEVDRVTSALAKYV